MNNVINFNPKRAKMDQLFFVKKQVLHDAAPIILYILL